jgi:hypothetical protein
MRRYNIPTLALDTRARGKITPEDVRFLQSNLFNGEEVWPHEARALFDLMQKRLPACDEWKNFIIEALSEYIVNELEPRGSLDEKNVRFLAAMLRRDEDNWSDIDAGVLVAVMEKAGSAPLSLQLFALEVTQRLMLEGKTGHSFQIPGLVHAELHPHAPPPDAGKPPVLAVVTEASAGAVPGLSTKAA